MGNMQGEFPKDDTITIRLHASEKKIAREIPFSYYEIFKTGLDHLSKEINRLEQRKDELTCLIAEHNEITSTYEKELAMINNRIRVIAPSKLDQDTLDKLINESTKEYAEAIFNAHKMNSLDRVKLEQPKHAIFLTARERGYDGNKFYELVVEHLNDMCNTGL